MLEDNNAPGRPPGQCAGMIPRPTLADRETDIQESAGFSIFRKINENVKKVFDIIFNLKY